MVVQAEGINPDPPDCTRVGGKERPWLWPRLEGMDGGVGIAGGERHTGGADVPTDIENGVHRTDIRDQGIGGAIEDPGDVGLGSLEILESQRQRTAWKGELTAADHRAVHSTTIGSRPGWLASDL